MKKLFCLDLDGTLLNSNESVSQENIEALKKAKSKDNILVFATGRNFAYSKICLKNNLSLFDYCIGCNGAFIIDLRNENIIYKCNKRIKFKIIKSFIKEIKEIGGTIQISTSKDTFIDNFIQEGQKIISQKTLSLLFEPFEQVIQMERKDIKDIIHVSIHLEQKIIDQKLNEWKEKYGSKYDFLKTNKNNIDICLKDTNKLVTIVKIIKKEKIEENNVYYFGDSQNDILVLDHFENTFAMSNGLKEAKLSAKHVIGNNNSNDIAKTILASLKGTKC